MDRVHPAMDSGPSFGTTPTPYGFDSQYTTIQQAQPPPYPPYSQPPSAWQYPPPPPPPKYESPGTPVSSYPMATPAYSQPMQQQQQQVVIIGGGMTRTRIPYRSVDTYFGQILLSCLVIWFCNFLFGIIAYALAVMANNSVVSDSKRARHLGRASYIVSVTGILVTCAAIAIVVGVIVGGTASAVSSISDSNDYISTCYNYYMNGVCYTYMSYYVSYSECISTYYGYYYNGYCYYTY